MSNVNKGSVKQRIADRINAGKIANRLHDHVMTKPGDKDYDKKVMSSTQINAARILLAKVVPDLKQVEFDGKVEQSITQITRKVVKPKPTRS